MRLQSAIFDMDGVLLDSMPMWRSRASALVLSHGITPPPDLDRKASVMGMWECLHYCKETCGLPGTVEDLAREIWGQIEEYYQTQVQLKAGVEKFLSLLKMEGIWTYIATATDRPLAEAALKHTGIDGYFRGMITSQEVNSSKRDSPKIYEYALRRLQSNKQDTVVFEDALHAVKTAKSAGFRVASVYDASEPEQEEMRRLGDYYITSFEEMYEL